MKPNWPWWMTTALSEGAMIQTKDGGIEIANNAMPVGKPPRGCSACVAPSMAIIRGKQRQGDT